MHVVLSQLIEIAATFTVWTFMLYWIHRFAHRIPVVRDFHQDHHQYINRNDGTAWHWNNLFLYNDTWKSTADLWITEVVPTLIFSWMTGYWWLSLFYYLWAALLQEVVEHNKNFDWYPFLTSGKWHLVHHRNQYRNYGLFVPVWDMMFRTYRRH